MSNTANLFFEQLHGRLLWVDGEETLTKQGLYDVILSDEQLEGIKISERDKEIEKFQKLTGISFDLKTKPNYNKIDDSFSLPVKYQKINLEEYFIKRMKKRIDLSLMSESDKAVTVERILTELEMYENRGLSDVLKTAIYIVDTFKENNLVWGPGRGSSCCSYLLYLIELHDVDSIAFDLPIDEFLR